MLKEFALDPSLLGNWKDFRFFLGQFGVTQGRLISRFPAKWKDMVRAAAAQSAKDVEFARIEDALTRIERVMLIRDCDYLNCHQWLRNAADEDQKRPFHAIISSQKTGSAGNILIGEDLDPTNPHALWIVPTSVQIAREPNAMSGCVEHLLSQCKEVMFIDPYFGPGKQTHIAPLQKFLDAIARRGTRPMPSRLEYHTGNLDLDRAAFQRNLDQRIKPLLPSNVKLTVVRWKKSEMHNRYILTDRGGVMFGHGLGVADGNTATHDTVSVLDDQTCENLMVAYSQNGKCFTWQNDLFSTTGQ